MLWVSMDRSVFRTIGLDFWPQYIECGKGKLHIRRIYV